MTPKIKVKPSASSPYDAPIITPSMVFWTRSTIGQRPSFRSAGGAARPEIGALDDLILRQLTGHPFEGDAPLLHQIELMRHLERHVGVLLHQEDGGAVAIELVDDAEDLSDN